MTGTKVLVMTLHSRVLFAGSTFFNVSAFLQVLLEIVNSAYAPEKKRASVRRGRAREKDAVEMARTSGDWKA